MTRHDATAVGIGWQSQDADDDSHASDLRPGMPGTYLAHSLSEEVYKRPTVQRQPSFMGVEIGSWREFWFGLVVIGLSWVALFYALPLLIGAGMAVTR